MLPLNYRTYRDPGLEEWVVFVPGAGAASAIWRRQIPTFSRRYNLLLIDLPGHGRSPKSKRDATYTFGLIAQRVIDAMDSECILRAHFMGMSLGSLIVEAIALRDPHRVITMVLAGGITGLNTLSRSLMRLGNRAKNFVPYMWLYRILAWTIMPGRHHLRTRRIFCAHAKRLSRSEFLRWYALSREVELLMVRSAERNSAIPTLFVMGANDHMFGPAVLERVKIRHDTAVMFLPNCGHACSVESPIAFNSIALDFILARKWTRA
jgi:pimeloyl-ACP methyl ester carboxylesterase